MVCKFLHITFKINVTKCMLYKFHKSLISFVDCVSSRRILFSFTEKFWNRNHLLQNFTLPYVSYYRRSNRSVNSKYNFECLNTYVFKSRPQLWYRFATKDDKFMNSLSNCRTCQIPISISETHRFESCWVAPFSQLGEEAEMPMRALFKIYLVKM